MTELWSERIKRYRLRHAMSQTQFSDLLGVSQRTISRWERDEDRPNLAVQHQLRDLIWQPPAELFASLSSAIRYCPVPRALSRARNLRLIALSPPAAAKRPSICDMIGRDLARLACGVLEDILQDKVVQRAIAMREIHCITTVTGSVLRTPEHPSIGKHNTTITYWSSDGVVYSDAVSAPAPENALIGYTPHYTDELIQPAG